MSPERWQRVQTLYFGALEREPDQREAFLAEGCGDDDDLRRHVEELLAAHFEAGDFLDSPAFELAAALALEGSDGGDEDRSPTDTGGETTAPLAPRHTGVADPIVGSLLDDKYRIEALIGVGGMGSVYRAVQTRLERAVAVKVMRDDALADPAAVARFRREALAVARLKNPHIVAIHDFGVVADAGAYIVMELLEGRTLRRTLASAGALPPYHAARLMVQVLSAAREAHAAGVIHRDFKPENIFLEDTLDGSRAKVLDFGIAKLQGPPNAGDVITNTGSILGTLIYMSPEQCRGDEVDPRSDVYSLGCVLFEMLTGRPPFTSRSPGRLIYEHLEKPPPRPSSVATTLPAALDDVVLRALAKEPSDRFQTAEAFAAALEAAAASPPSGSRTLTIGAGVYPVAESAPRRAVPNNLPHRARPFVGREREVAAAARLLATGRVVTLTGAGGTGKTRLAEEVAEQLLSEYRDGVFVVDLAPFADPDLLLPTVARTIGMKPDGATPALVAEAVGDRRMLLVLDNFEQILDAAHLVSELVTRTSELKVLATSRAPLRIRAERELSIAPLECPESGSFPTDEIARFEAVALFVERARSIQPEFELTDDNAAAVAEICRRLDGLPLAIELAVARLKLFSPEAMVPRLANRLTLLAGGPRDLPERQRTMRAAIAWSFDLLGDGERELYERLAVFSGGFTLEAAEAMAGSVEPDTTSADAPPAEDVLDLLGVLIENSLLRRLADVHGERRFGMLETIRDFAIERLEASGAKHEAERRHAEYFLSVGRRAEPLLWGARTAEWLDRLEAEHDNLRAALTWLLESAPEECLSLCVAVRNLWMTHGHYSQGRRWLEAALGRATAAPPALRAAGLRAAGYLAQQQGDLEKANAFMRQSLAIARAEGDKVLVAQASRGLGIVAKAQGDIATARECLEESLAIGWETGDDMLGIYALLGLGEIARGQGDLGAARPFYRQALALSRRADHQVGMSMSFVNLGSLCTEEGDLESAVGYFAKALEIEQRTGSRSEMSVTLDALGAVAAKRGDWERAARLAGAAQSLREAIAYEPAGADRLARDRYVRSVREALDSAAFERATVEGRALTLEQAIDLGLGSSAP